MKALAALLLGTAALGGAAPPAHVQVVAKEYSFALSRLHVKAGAATLMALPAEAF